MLVSKSQRKNETKQRRLQNARKRITQNHLSHKDKDNPITPRIILWQKHYLLEQIQSANDRTMRQGHKHLEKSNTWYDSCEQGWLIRHWHVGMAVLLKADDGSANQGTALHKRIPRSRIEDGPAQLGKVPISGKHRFLQLEMRQNKHTQKMTVRRAFHIYLRELLHCAIKTTHLYCFTDIVQCFTIRRCMLLFIKKIN